MVRRSITLSTSNAQFADFPRPRFAVTSRDIDFLTDRDQPLSQVMTTNLIVGKESMSLEEANATMRGSKKAKLPIVNDKHELVALMSRSYVPRLVSEVRKCVI